MGRRGQACSLTVKIWSPPSRLPGPSAWLLSVTNSSTSSSTAACLASMLPSALPWPHPPLIPAVPLFLTSHSRLRGNLEKAMEMHSSIKSRLGPPLPGPRGTSCSQPPAPAPKLGVIDFIRCINPVSRAQEASLIPDALSEPWGAFKNSQSLYRVESANGSPSLLASL